jgi:hypothetical protein
VPDERGSQEGDRVTCRRLVERFVGQRTGTGQQLAQNRRRGGLAHGEPVQHAVGGLGALELGEVAVQRGERDRIAAGS